MSDIATDIFRFPTTSDSTATASTVKAKDEDMMGKEDFLTLLVAQLKNQDPLNPDDPTEFTAQLAQFSSLEQLTNLNDSMADLTKAQSQSERLSAMDLIGKEVVYASGKFDFDGTSSEIGYQLDGPASSVSINIINEAGATITTLHPTDVSKGNHFITWDGRDSEGNIVEKGKYNLAITASADGEGATVAISPLVRSEVTGLIMDSETGAAILQTAGGQVAVSDILAAYKIETKTIVEITEDEEETAETSTDGEESTSSTADTIAEVAEVTGIATPSDSTESAPKDEDQIAKDLLTHHLSG